jgi:endonuclease YncB( thermonuclease family)
VIDGDTFHVHYEVQTRLLKSTSVLKEDQRVRLLGIDCPEKRAPGGPEATAYTLAWLHTHLHLRELGPEGLPLLLEGDAWDSFGRVLAVVSCHLDGAVLNLDLLNSGHAAPYRALPHADALVQLDRAGSYPAGALLSEMGDAQP